MRCHLKYAETILGTALLTHFLILDSWQSFAALSVALMCKVACLILIKPKGSDSDLTALKSKLEHTSNEVKKLSLKLGFK